MYTKCRQVAINDGAVTARMQFDATTDELSTMGDWQQKVLQQIYARLPAVADLTKFAGFGTRGAYLIVEDLLDPRLMPEFRGMVIAFYEDIPELLEDHKQVLHPLSLAQTCTACLPDCAIFSLCLVLPVGHTVPSQLQLS